MTLDSSLNAASGNSKPAAATFSSTWAAEEVPGMGRITLDRLSSQASPVCRVLAPRSLATVPAPQAPFCSGPAEPREKGDAMLLAILDHVIPLAVGEAIAILHRDDGDDFAAALDVLVGHVGEARHGESCPARAVWPVSPSMRRRRRPDRERGAGRHRCDRVADA